MFSTENRFLVYHRSIRVKCEVVHAVYRGKWHCFFKYCERAEDSLCVGLFFPSALQWRGSRGGARGPALPLFLDQNGAQRAEKIWGGTVPPLFQGLDDRIPPLISRSGSVTALTPFYLFPLCTYLRLCYNQLDKIRGLFCTAELHAK